MGDCCAYLLTTSYNAVVYALLQCPNRPNVLAIVSTLIHGVATLLQGTLLYFRQYDVTTGHMTVTIAIGNMMLLQGTGL